MSELLTPPSGLPPPPMHIMNIFTIRGRVRGGHAAAISFSAFALEGTNVAQLEQSLRLTLAQWDLSEVGCGAHTTTTLIATQAEGRASARAILQSGARDPTRRPLEFMLPAPS